MNGQAAASGRGGRHRASDTSGDEEDAGDAGPLDRLHLLIREGFPLARFMGVAPRSWDQEGLVLQAPAQPNVNVHGTMFGGGIAALGILAGWGWLRLELDARGVDADVVVQDVRTRYLEPLRGDGLARCLPPDPGDLDRFFRMLRRRGRGRLGLRVEIGPDIAEQAAIDGVASPAAAAASSRAGSRGAEPVAIIEARFVAIGPP